MCDAKLVKPGISVGHIITGLDSGGAQSALYRLCLADSSNHHFVISLMDDGRYGVPLRESGITVYCLNMPKGRMTARGAHDLWCLLRRHRPDVVQTWLYHSDLIGGVLASFAGIRSVYWGVRSGELLWMTGHRVTSMVRLVNVLLSWFIPTAIICNSARAAEIHRGIGYCAKKIKVIPNGIDTSDFRPDVSLRESIRKEWNVPAALPLLGSIGRYTPYKDYDNLITALSLVRRSEVDFRCVLVGQGIGENNEALVTQLASSGLRDYVVLSGPRSDMPSVMNALDVLVLPSVAEGFPSVLIEAMACGIPCVTTDVGDAANIVGETGWVIPPKDPAALANAISEACLTLRDEPALRLRKYACRDRVLRNFTLSGMIDAYCSVWHCGAPSVLPESPLS